MYSAVSVDTYTVGVSVGGQYRYRYYRYCRYVHSLVGVSIGGHVGQDGVLSVAEDHLRKRS